jgi:hypothetical protein
MEYEPETLYARSIEGLIELLDRGEPPQSPWLNELRADLQQWQRFHNIGQTIFIGNMGGFTDWNYRDPWANGAFEGLLAAAYTAVDGIKRNRSVVGETGGFRFENRLGSASCPRCQRVFMNSEWLALAAGQSWARKWVRQLLTSGGPSRVVERALNGSSDVTCQDELRSLQASARAVGLELVDYNPQFDERCRVCGGPWVAKNWEVFPEPPRLRPV